MWKGRPVIGSAVGGIIDQIAEGTGVLLPDPPISQRSEPRCAGLLDDAGERSRLGAAAHAHVRDNFVGDLHLMRYAEVFTVLMSQLGTRP